MSTIGPQTGEWIAQLDSDDRNDQRFSSAENLLEFIASAAQRRSGRLEVAIDKGRRSNWGRFLGLSDRIIAQCLAVEWTEHVASLIFFDDADSEFRALDPEHPVQTSEESRRQVSHGEATPTPMDECMAVSRAWEAIRHFIRHRTRPDWLSCRYVK